MHRTTLLAATLSALGALAAAVQGQAIPLVGKPMPDEVEILEVKLGADAPATAPLTAASGGVRFTGDAGWIEFELRVDTNGRYRCELETADGPENGTAWVEDYVENPDGRSYDVTGPMSMPAGGGRAVRDGSPLVMVHTVLRDLVPPGSLSLTPTDADAGSHGVLLKAKRDGQIPSLKFEMDRLVKNAGFFVSDHVRNTFLAGAGEDSFNVNP